MRRPEPKHTMHHYKGYDILGTHYTETRSGANKRTYNIQKGGKYVVTPELILERLKDAKEYVDEELVNYC